MEETVNKAEQEAAAAKKAKHDEYIKHLSLETYSEDTKFLEIDYAGKGAKGRTVIALGTFAMHVRSVGHKKGKIWNESLAIHEDGEQNFDILLMRLRHDISGIDLIRRVRTEEETEALIEGLDPNQAHICHLVIYFRAGSSYEINGLPEIMALGIRKVIYAWISSMY